MPVPTNDEHVERFEEYANIWSGLWKDTRDSLAIGEQPTFDHWDANEPACA